MKMVGPRRSSALGRDSLGAELGTNREPSENVLHTSTRIVLLEDSSATALSRLLQTLGVSFERETSLEEALSIRSIGSSKADVLILSGRHLRAARALAHARSVSLPQLFAEFAAVLLCAWNGEPDDVAALAEWIGGKIEVTRLQGEEHCYSVKPLALAKPFSGLRFGPIKSAADFGLTLSESSYPIEEIATIGGLSFFFRVTLPGTQLFVSCSSAVFDVDAEARRNPRAAWRFSGLVLLLLFLRHRGISSWRTSLRAANIVIDDPDLQESYGFIETKRLVRCVDELGCAVSIAFIPWNFKRTSPAVVELFRTGWPRLSLCVHGCDHVRAEFCSDKVSSSSQLIALALDRMERLSRNTGLTYDKIMVFPRGEFSGAAMQALRESSFLAGVNTELIDSQTGHGVPAGQLLQPAITKHAGFPLFLRRSADEPIANFALDLLLGKPCLVRMHHDYFREGLDPFVDLVDSLNALDPSLSWTNLETIVSQTYSARLDSDSRGEVRLFSPYTRLTTQKRFISFLKREPLQDKTFEASIEGREIAASRDGENVVFPAEVETESETAIRIGISPVPPPRLPSYSLRYRMRVATRRYLSRIRDNHDTGPAWKRVLWEVVRRISAKENASEEEPS